MNINLFSIKDASRRLMPIARPSPITAGFLVLMLSSLVDYYMLFSTGLYHLADNEAINYYLDGHFDYLEAYLLQNIHPTTSVLLVVLLLYIVVFLVSYGLRSFLMKTVRSEPTQIGDLLNGFPLTLKILIKTLVQWLVLIPCSLVIVPGFILFYAYRLSDYLLLDRPELSPIECLRESRRLMKGHKLELFRLDLSFLGWLIVSRLGALGIATRVWSLPFMETSYVLYYGAILAVDRDEGPYSISLDTIQKN